MILIDTNIISELWREKPSSGVSHWLQAQDSTGVFISAITLAEIQFGIAKLPVSIRRSNLVVAVTRLEQETFSGQVLPFDNRCAAPFGLVRASREQMRHPISFPDAAIAATALTHGLTLATRNIRDFDGLDLMLVNPFEA
ncbi:MAG: type II toxin-antitoxin system VapC family toxin [Beijerinckiaceae bacterium]